MRETEQQTTSYFRVTRDLIRLAIPLGFVQLSFQLTGLVDTAVAGRLGEVSLAGVGLGASTFFTASIFGVGVGLGLDPIVSQAMGAQRFKDARHCLWQGIYLAFFISFPLGVMAVGIAENLGTFGVVPEVAEVARQYVWGRLLNIFAFYGIVALRTYLQAAHLAGPIVISSILANVLNLVFDWVFAFGDAGWTPWGLPAIGFDGWGAVGIAWASTLTGFIQLGILAFAIRKIKFDSRSSETGVRSFSPIIVRQLLQLGFPIGLQLLAEVGVFSLVHIMIGTMNSTAAAGHQTAIMLASLTFAMCVGIGAATSVQVGRAIGANKLAEARASGLSGIAVGAGFMALSAITMLLAPRLLSAMLTSDAAVIDVSVRLLQIAAVFQIVDGIQAVASGALRGAGITRWPLIALLISHWGVGLPVGLYLSFSFGMGEEGLWWGLTLGLTVAAISLAYKFFQVSRANRLNQLKIPLGQ